MMKRWKCGRCFNITESDEKLVRCKVCSAHSYWIEEVEDDTEIQQTER